MREEVPALEERTLEQEDQASLVTRAIEKYSCCDVTAVAGPMEVVPSGGQDPNDEMHFAHKGNGKC